MVVGSWVNVKILVLMLQTRRRSIDLNVRMGRAYLWQAYGLLAWDLYLLLLLLNGPRIQLALLVGLALVPNMFLILMMILGQTLESSGLSRGALHTGIHSLARKAQIRRLSICLLQDDSRPRLRALITRSVLIHRRFLDVMGRAEIDALAARQLARLQGPLFRPVDAYLLVGALAAAGLCELLHPGMAGWWLLLMALVAVETAALALYLPRADMQSDLRAIALTGNPDAFFSALGESVRLTGAALDLPALEKTAQRAGVSADRLRALLEPQPRPAEDRYPTSGDYVTVGF
jgi:hypothetical protein